MDPAARSKPPEPQARKVTLCSAAAVGCLQALDALVHEHRKTEVTVHYWHGEEQELLGNIDWGFPDPDPRRPAEADARKRLPLYEVWKEWYENRPKKLQDRDGLELLRASVWGNVEP